MKMKSFYDYDRLDLEQDILKIFGIAEMLDEFLRQYLDGGEKFTEDEVFNKVNAIKEVLAMQNQRLWNGFERMIATKQFAKLKEPKDGK